MVKNTLNKYNPKLSSLTRPFGQIFDVVEQYAPGFRRSIVGYEILTPTRLQEVFGLTGGVSRPPGLHATGT